jgi:hypothetical protein
VEAFEGTLPTGDGSWRITPTDDGRYILSVTTATGSFDDEYATLDEAREDVRRLERMASPAEGSD